MAFRTTITDLSERLRAQEARAQAEEERRRLRHEEELVRAEGEAKDRFIAVLSHELRTPLSPILLAVTQLEARRDLPPTLRPALAMIRRNLELETRLVDDLLDVTRITQGKLELRRAVVDLHAALRDALEMCASEIGPGQSVATGLAAREHHVDADPARLRQVFANLVRNAARATRNGGKITVRSANEGTGRITVSVTDTGIGIEPADLERIFAPFTQGEAGARTGGLGLGLAICKTVVETLGGRISATSAGPDHGARFEVELPTVAAVAAPERAALPAPARHGASKLRILLVEDHPDTASAVSEALRLEGYEVRMADTVRGALEQARDAYDLVVSDLRLPDGSGLDLMRQLRAERPVRGIALSGFGSETDVRRSKEAGFDEHLTKPVAIQTLTSTIESLAARGGAEGSGERETG